MTEHCRRAGDDQVIKVVSWNIGRSAEPWRELAQMAEAGDVDVALLQEAGMPPDDVAVEIGPREHWDSHVWNSHWYKDRWPRLYDRWPMVVKLSPRASVEWLKQISPISDGNEDEIAVSGIGTIAAARVASSDGGQEPFIAISMYARWMEASHVRQDAMACWTR